MAAWLPVLRAALPYVSSIVAAALPVLTSRKDQDASAELVSRQIAELQAAVTGNAEAVKGLAAQVEKTLTALDAGEADLAQRIALQLEQQLANLHDTVARCESTGTLAQAQVTRLDGVTAALMMRVEELELQFKRQQARTRRREIGVAVIALFALLLAVIALLR